MPTIEQLMKDIRRAQERGVAELDEALQNQYDELAQKQLEACNRCRKEQGDADEPRGYCEARGQTPEEKK